MTTKTTITLTVTQEELELIRVALCEKSMKTLYMAINHAKEEEEKGLDDLNSRLTYAVRDKIRAIIADIDKVQ